MLFSSKQMQLASLLVTFLPLIQAFSIPASALEKRYTPGKCSVYIKQKLYNYSGAHPKPNPDYNLATYIQIYDDSKNLIGGDDSLRTNFLGKYNDGFSQLPYVTVFKMIDSPTSTSHTDVSFAYAGDLWSSTDGSRCTWDPDSWNIDSAGDFYTGGVRCTFHCNPPPAPIGIPTGQTQPDIGSPTSQPTAPVSTSTSQVAGLPTPH